MGRTRTLSGLISACTMLHLRISDSAKNIWCAYALTARIFSPTSLPKRLMTSRRFMLTQVSRLVSTRHTTDLKLSVTMHK